MLDTIGLLGLMVGLAAVFWLMVASFFRGPRRWATWAVVVGLALFFGSMMIPAPQNEQIATPQETATTAPQARQEEAATGVTAVKATHPQCSQPPTFAGDRSSEFLGGDVWYSLMQAASCADTMAGSRSQTVWAFIGMKNEGARTVEINPWFDLWLMPLPLGVDMPYPPQPTHVDVLEIAGPIPLPNNRSLLLEAGESCLLQITFQLPPQALRALLNIGYV